MPQDILIDFLKELVFSYGVDAVKELLRRIANGEDVQHMALDGNPVAHDLVEKLSGHDSIPISEGALNGSEFNDYLYDAGISHFGDNLYDDASDFGNGLADSDWIDSSFSSDTSMTEFGASDS